MEVRLQKHSYFWLIKNIYLDNPNLSVFGNYICSKLMESKANNLNNAWKWSWYYFNVKGKISNRKYEAPINQKSPNANLA
jgi:hypothetical protein